MILLLTQTPCSLPPSPFDLVVDGMFLQWSTTDFVYPVLWHRFRVTIHIPSLMIFFGYLTFTNGDPLLTPHLSTHCLQSTKWFGKSWITKNFKCTYITTIIQKIQIKKFISQTNESFIVVNECTKFESNVLDIWRLE